MLASTPAAVAGAAAPAPAGVAAISQHAVALHRVGRVNLRALAAADAHHGRIRATGPGHEVSLRRPPSALRPTGGGTGVRASVPGPLSHITGSNVPGENGFTGITTLGSANANPAFGAVSPPERDWRSARPGQA